MEEITVEKVKNLIIENCMLSIDPAEICEDSPLFGPDSIGLDSVDALQIMVAVEKNFNITLSDSQTAREAMQSPATLQRWIVSQQRLQGEQANRS